MLSAGDVYCDNYHCNDNEHPPVYDPFGIHAEPLNVMHLASCMLHFVAEVVSPSNPGMDYVSKLNLYREANVREYWICDSQQNRVLTYVFDSQSVMQTYEFSTPVPSEVCPGFEFAFGQVMAGM